MSEKSERFAAALRLFAWISFWVQVVLAVVASLIFLFAAVFAIPGSGAGSGGSNPGTGGGLFFAICGLFALYASIWKAFGYTRLAKKLKSPTPSLRPSKANTMQGLRLGLYINLVGMGLTLLAAEAITGVLLAKSLSQPQVLYNPAINLSEFIQPLDIFVVLGNTHTTVAHFSGILVVLWLLNSINK